MQVNISLQYAGKIGNTIKEAHTSADWKVLKEEAGELFPNINEKSLKNGNSPQKFNLLRAAGILCA